MSTCGDCWWRTADFTPDGRMVRLCAKGEVASTDLKADRPSCEGFEPKGKDGYESYINFYEDRYTRIIDLVRQNL